MKRYTYWPQLFLGVTFNYGIILGWTAINNEINLVPLLLYFGAIFWTLGYDTIYGFQDIKDDEIIGLKSTSIKFKKSPYIFLYVCYLIFFLTLIMIGFFMKLNNMYFISLILIFLQLFYLQIKKLNIKSSKECLKIFKSNNYLGFFVFIALLVGKT
jgi:4-hydroxybenzoate polyprenyltransferase